ncbi:hypothetical protein [Planobacterium oryzisoli]|uniref:GIY-YIG domain-containing protein n=1 Tax=Planobacterium oryzisoli TaxID=2771435 RepID=A0A930YWF0_9FLAO|nr:hypothetical protein [Planobacterium oryzisoli]MBF5027571.1 hypothetical protein [Planobacterium oryzisoli]
MIDIKNAAKSYIENLTATLERVAKYSEGISFQKIKLDFVDYQESHLKILDKSNGIYMIALSENCSIKPEKICSKVNSFKKNKRKYKFPKVNEKNCVGENRILYIGKSKGNMKKRIEAHLGLANPSTYALQLKFWGEDNYLKDAKLEIHYAFVEMPDEDIETDILEILETALHKNYKPMLGRSGH